MNSGLDPTNPAANTASTSFVTSLPPSAPATTGNFQANVDFQSGLVDFSHHRAPSGSSSSGVGSSATSFRQPQHHLHQSAPSGLAAAATDLSTTGLSSSLRPQSSNSGFTTAVTVDSYFAPLSRTISASPMQTDYTSPYLQGGPSQLTSFSNSFGTSNTEANNSDLNLDLSGWSSRNPTAQQLTNSPQQQQQQKQQQQQQQQQHLQRANAASTLSSLARHQGPGSPAASVDTSKKRLKKKGREPEGVSGGSLDKAGGQMKKSHSAQQPQSVQLSKTHTQQSSGLNASAFVPEIEDEEDELGGGSSSMNADYAQQQNRNTSTSIGYSSSSAPSGSGTWESSEGKEGGGTRKQNSACDACRNRKVRCNRIAGEEKCAHCKSKGIDCTTFFVQLATTSAKRPTKRARQSAEGGVER